MVVWLLIALAAFFNSVMDAIENENFFESVFRNLKHKFWYKRESWKHSKKLFGYKLDAWHIAKSLMIISLSVAITLAFYCKGIFNTGSVIIDSLLNICICGVIWNFSFWLFYHKLFKCK